jgi:transcriptional regulator with XRE-family HTH domain
MRPEELRAWRQRVGVTQAEAAEVAGVSVNTWARWERGALGIHPLRINDLLTKLEGVPTK